MADNGLLVTISGAALSLLLYETVRSVGDQMGFLVGDVLVFVTKNVTDSDRQVEYVRTHINIDAVVTCPLADLMHDTVGKINKEKLKDFMRDKSKQVVGWFRFRRNSSLVPTLRDKILHRQLASYFCGSNSSKEELFVACLLNTSESHMGGTHKYRHVFLHYKRGIYEPIPLRINNLGGDSSRPDGSDYKPTPRKTLADEHDIFGEVINSLSLDVLRTPGVESVTAIQKAAENHLRALIPKVCESEQEVAELERQVRELRTKILARKSSNKIREEDNLRVTQSNLQSGREIDDENAWKTKEFDSKNITANYKHKEISPPKDHSILDQTLSISRQRNTTNTKNTNQEREKNVALRTSAYSNAKQDPSEPMVSEMKVGINESKRSSLVARSASKGEPSVSSFGRGSVQSSYTERKPRQLLTKKSNAERSPQPMHSFDQELLDNDSVQNSSPFPSASYSQMTRRSVDRINNFTKESDN